MKREKLVSILLLTGGVVLVASGLPITFSGVGGPPPSAIPAGKSPSAPSGTMIAITHGDVTLWLEPAFFVGITFLIAGVYLIGQATKTFFGLKIDKLEPHPEFHR